MVKKKLRCTFLQIIFFFRLPAQEINIIPEERQVLNNEQKIKFDIINISKDTVFILTANNGSLIRAGISTVKRDTLLKDVEVYYNYTIIRCQKSWFKKKYLSCNLINDIYEIYLCYY